MFGINLVWAVLIFFTVYMVIFSFLIRFFEPKLPKFISDSFRYGKTTNQDNGLSQLVRLIQVPKAYFTHFYIFAVIFVGFLTSLTVRVVIIGHSLPIWVSTALDILCQENRVTSTTPEGILIVMLLFNIQCWRRLYECFYVNVDSGTKMNILHYIVGFAHYFCAGIGFISESPGFAEHAHVLDSVKWVHIEPELRNITPIQTIAILVFFLAWYHQFEAHKIFADLKRKSNGTHTIPYGDWFKYLSCPHYFAEILIYLALAVILGLKHQTAWLVFVWVLTNQIIAGLMSHWWYKEKFDKSYPTTRKAVIPFLI